MTDLADEIRTYIDNAAPPVTLVEVRGWHHQEVVPDRSATPLVSLGTALPPAPWRPRTATVLSAAVLVLVVLVGVGFLVARSPRSANSATTRPSTSVVTPSTRSLMTAQQAIAMELPSMETVTRSAAKLVTYGEVLAEAEPQATFRHPPTALSSRVWVVALAGTVNPNLSTSLLPEHYTWEAVFIDQLTRRPLGSVIGGTGTWPPFFNALPDLSHAQEGSGAKSNLPVPLRTVESFFDGQGASNWTKHTQSSSVTGTVASCSVIIAGAPGLTKATRLRVLCQQPGPDAIAVPADEVALLHATVAKFSPAASSAVDALRTTAASSFYSGDGVEVQIDSHPPPGSGLPVLELSIQSR